jgi:hypothetical protein
MMKNPNGVLINSGGTITSVVYGWSDAAVPPDGQTFLAVADVSGFEAGQPAAKVFAASAQAALDASDTTMLRVTEAVALGLTTMSADDVVAWVNYRRALRALLKSTTIASLPARPAYPVGT